MVKPIGIAVLTNTIAVVIYEIKHDITDKVLAGVTGQKPEWCDIEGDTFKVGQMSINLNECLRTQ